MGTVAKFIADTKYDDLPTDVIEKAKLRLMDVVACTIAGSSFEGAKELVDFVVEKGGKKEATIPVFGNRVPVASAGFAIGYMARARDLGTVAEVYPVAHVGEHIFPAMLPTAEAIRSSGRQFLLAWILGKEILTRIGNAESHKVYCTDYGHSAWFAIWGATAAVAKLLGLDEAATWNAMGIAYQQVSGEMQYAVDGSQSKCLQHSFRAQDAVTSALLAQRGFTGPRGVLLGKYGYFTCFVPPQCEADPALITSNLGKEWIGLDSSIKPYPSCKYTHTPIWGTIKLMKENRIALDDIRSIRVILGSAAYPFVCVPKEKKYDPQTSIDGQFSVPYLVATAALKGSVSFDDFSAEALRNASVRALMQRTIEVGEDTGLGLFEAFVGIVTKDGGVFEERINYVKGHPRNPMGWDEEAAKLEGCVSMSAKRFSDRRVKKLIQVLRNIEELDDMRNLARLLVPSGPGTD